MSTQDLDSYMDAAATVLGLTIDPEWRETVRANLEVSLKMARLVQDFALPDETESASIYEA